MIEHKDLLTDRNIIFFDLETTGTSVTKDRIVQLSCFKVNTKFELIEPIKDIIVNPEMEIPKGASDVHGITNEMVLGKPTFKQYAQAVYDYFKDCNLAGYNIKHFDIPLLIEEFFRCGFDFNVSNKLIYDAYKIFSTKEKRDLTYALKFYTGKEMEGAHNAVNDNLATLDILKAQFFQYGLDFNTAHYEFKDEKEVDLTGKLIKNENGEICYNIGKAKGVPVIKDFGFGEWMIRESSDFPRDTKGIIKKILYAKP